MIVSVPDVPLPLPTGDQLDRLLQGLAGARRLVDNHDLEELRRRTLAQLVTLRGFRQAEDGHLEAAPTPTQPSMEIHAVAPLVSWSSVASSSGAVPVVPQASSQPKTSKLAVQTQGSAAAPFELPTSSDDGDDNDST
ncbi:Aste57867_23590 [Aphanomyces stellatus]|uniref:Aste57867_23590 protein n=1 Tax=Aphanomyces stellatus TaxID=120398 RepID=A0A485LNX8_9STRA|nr:hypothetical protein As57867_023518 [Aphanomyces stellatus]VFU00235.1 Aste57867_23590 [Aphanomyces stellatus]